MKKKTRTMTLSAMLTALTVVFLYLASLLPTVRVALAAAASLFAVAAVIENGKVAAVLVYISSAVISTFILPDKTPVLIYVLFFGYYPVIKSLAEGIRSMILHWAVKLTVFEASFTVIWFLFRNLVFNGREFSIHTIFIYLIATLAFVVFDIGLSGLIGFYIQRITKNLNKK